MSEDAGLWLVNGKITTNKERERVWAIHQQKWNRIYKEECKLEERDTEENSIKLIINSRR